MSRFALLGLACSAVLALGTAAVTSISHETPQDAISAPQHLAVAQTSEESLADDVGDLVAYLHWEDQAIDTYLTALTVDAYLTAVHEAELAEAARQAAMRTIVRAPAPAVQSTGSCGGATNGADRYIARESGGNPGIFNQGGSGAYGCYQIMPGTWASSCRDLGPEIGSSPATQAACASRLPLSAWGG